MNTLYFNLAILNLLIIEDDKFLSSKIVDLFYKNTFINLFKQIYSYDTFLKELCIIKSYDIILIDINLPGNKDGIDIVKQIRKKQINIPIIIMSCYNGYDRLEKAFYFGANDYIVKPFRLKEFEIRICKWFKTYLANLNLNICDRQINYFDLKYDIVNNNFYFKNKEIKLTKKSKYLLFLFISNSEILLKNDYLVEKIWGDIDFFIDRNLRIHILRLKNILKDFGIDSWIKNVRSEGYIFKKD